jgi:hypothetical protein
MDPFAVFCAMAPPGDRAMIGRRFLRARRTAHPTRRPMAQINVEQHSYCEDKNPTIGIITA